MTLGRTALLIGALLALNASNAMAAHKKAACCEPVCNSTPCMKTIQVIECVPETYQVKRTCYKMECRTEVVDGFRSECVPEVRENVCTVIKRIPVITTEVRKVCVNVPTCEERIEMKPCYKTVKECQIVRKCVKKTHYECCNELVPFNCFDKLSKRCPDSVDNCCKPMKIKTKKVKVVCNEYVDCPVTVCKKVCEMVPTKVIVRGCRQEIREEKVNICTIKCVEEKVVNKCTVYVTRQVPCKITRTVQVCVPFEVTETCTRMVPRCVTREVPSCETSCCPAPAPRRCHGLQLRTKSTSCCE